MGDDGVEIGETDVFDWFSAHAVSTAQLAVDTSLHDAILSATHGIEGTQSAVALRRLAAQAAREVATVADRVERDGRAARRSGVDYRATDDGAAGQLRRTGL